jgi:glycosyltransferase involved in cell wall biosynthesis
MMDRFKLIVPSFNSIDYLPKTLHSIEVQTDKAFDVCVIDDCSTIPEQRRIIESFCAKNKWQFLFNDKNYGALYGMVKAIEQMNCHDQDVIVIIDGDDWLAHEDVLKHLRKIYTNEDVHLTWGQCEIYPRGKMPMKYAQPIPEMVIKQKLYRDIPFVFWHLGTFKYFLWKHIDDKDLRDIDGEYLRIMKDKATLYPMLEMAGKKIRFVGETLYIYNLENPLNDYANTRPEEHVRVDALIRSRTRYPTLKDCNE